MFSIPPTERRSVLCLFLIGFGNSGAYLIARTIADSAFLSHIGPEELPVMYLIAAVVVTVSSLFYLRMSRPIPLRQSTQATLVMFAGIWTVCPSFMAMYSESVVVFGIVYLLAQVRGSLSTIQFATLLHEQFADRQPERVIGIVGSGATFAGMSTGLLIGVLAERIDPESLLYLAAVMEASTILPVMWLPSRDPGSLTDQQPDSTEPQPALTEEEGKLSDVLRSGYFLIIAAIVATSVMACTLVEFQWKVAATDFFDQDEGALAEFFGYFYAAMDLFTSVMRLFVTRRILMSRGVLAALLTFPAALLLASGSVMLVSAQRFWLWAMTFAKGCDTLKRSLHEPAIQILYVPFESPSRETAITFVSGMIKPIAEAVAAIGLLVLSHLVAYRALSIPILILLAVWIALIFTGWWLYEKRTPEHEHG